MCYGIAASVRSSPHLSSLFTLQLGFLTKVRSGDWSGDSPHAEWRNQIEQYSAHTCQIIVQATSTTHASDPAPVPQYTSREKLFVHTRAERAAAKSRGAATLTTMRYIVSVNPFRTAVEPVPRAFSQGMY